MSSFLKKGERTVNAYWSKIWVQQRIVPSDRQNIAQILKANHLKEYDEFELLMLSQGRCSQDDCYLVPIQFNAVSKDFLLRFEQKIEYAIPLEEYRVLVSFRNEKLKVCDVSDIFNEMIAHNKKYAEKEIFKSVKIMAGGYGLSWGSALQISDKELYERGKIIPLTKEDLVSIVNNGMVNSAEAAQMLGCSRQNIEDLIKRDKIQPIQVKEKNKLFFRDDILKREWE